MLDLGTLKIGITVDDKQATQGLQNLDNQLDKTSKGSGKLGKAFGKVGKAVGIGAAAAATGIVALGKKSLDLYSTFEQMEGGVEKLFGNSAQTVMNNAAEAFATTGLSANAYMETVTSSSAALIKSLGGNTEKAASQSDKMITQMADNASIFGTSMDTLQQAYGNFARNNYTMLDNLKLGYSGTKEGMQQLLDDASKISGIDYDISSYSDIIDAIQVIQEEENIAGNAAAEAAKTIQGSTAMAKAAWTNLLTGLADDDADIGKLVDNLVESFTTAAENIIPRLGQILETLPSAFAGIATGILPILMEMINTTLPSFISGVVAMITTLSSTILALLPPLFQSIVSMLPQLLTQILNAIVTLIPQIVTCLTAMIPMIVAIIPQLIQALIAALPQIISALVNSLPNLIMTLVTTIIAYAPQIAAGLIKAFVIAVAEVVAAIPSLIANLAVALGANIGALFDSIKNWITTGEWKFEPIQIDFETGEIIDVTETGNELANTDYGSAEIDFDANTTQFDAGAQEVETKKEEIDGSESIAEIQADTESALANLEGIKKVEESMPKEFKHTISITAEGLTKTTTTLGNFVTTFNNLKKKVGNKFTIKVAANVKAASQSINSLTKKAKKITVKVTANVTSALASISKVIAKKIPNKSFSVSVSGYASVMSKLNAINNKKLRDKSFTVTEIHKTKKDGSKRIGLREVPYDGYISELHKGEAVLTAAEVNQYKRALEAQQIQKQTSEQLTNFNTEATSYNIGDVTLEVSKLQDVATLEDIVKIFRQAKAFA